MSLRKKILLSRKISKLFVSLRKKPLSTQENSMLNSMPDNWKFLGNSSKYNDRLRLTNSKSYFPLVKMKSMSNVFQMFTLRLADQHKDTNALHAHCIPAESPNLGSV